VFPLKDFDKVEMINGMNITYVATAKGDEEVRELLGALGMRFRS
jgi:large subunit ribosomal protein L5